MPAPASLAPDNGQPSLLHALTTADPDIKLLFLLSEGVPTGALSELPRSMQWPLKEHADLPHEQPPKQSPALCLPFWIKISNGWVVRTEMSIKQARQHWNTGIAVGKLNVACQETARRRPVGRCAPNPQAVIPTT